MAHLGRCGLSAACLDYRGVGGLLLTSARVGCVDSWRDLADAMRAVRAALAAAGNACAPLAAIGFSMGGTMLAKYLSMPSLDPPLVCAVTVSSPFDLTAAKRTLESSWAKRVLNFGLTQVVKLSFAAQQGSRVHLAGIDWPAFLSSGSLRALEEATICKLHGYDDAEAYYTLNQVRACSRVSGSARARGE
jgi:predicted alpha/beta-fold hydrolase